MLTRRIIPCLDVRNGRVVKGVNFEGLRDVDDPVALARFYNDSGADELVFYDITPAPRAARCLRTRCAPWRRRCSSPSPWGGSINTLDDFDRALKCGADKVSVNSGAIRDPSLIARAASATADQCVVLSMDVKRVDGRFHVFARGGRDDTGLDAIDWVRRGVDSGRGRGRGQLHRHRRACAGALIWKCFGPWARRCPCPSSPPAARAAARIF